MNVVDLAREPDFSLGALKLSPSTGRAFDGAREIRVEAQTMALLIVLARADGATVTRDDLVDACWKGRVVSDDAIGRAIAKVRAVARETTPPAFNLQTIPKIGYRLIAAAVTAPAQATTVAEVGADSELPARFTRLSRQPLAIAAVAIAAVAVVWGAGAMVRQPSSASATPPLNAAPEAAQVFDAVMHLDRERLALYIESGWDPNWHLDTESNTALHILPQVCERNPTHDQQGVLRTAQFLVAAGAVPTTLNKWNDSPLIIAASPRYCGPNHPVTAYLRTQSQPATALARRNRRS